jgi:C-terminal processing protease CtpA/Prc
MMGSPAERSGLRQGDLIRSIAGTQTKDLNEALSLLG